MFETFIAIGIIVSLVYYELTQLSPGGLITPGYLVLFFDQPQRLLATFVVAMVTMLVVRFLKKYLPIYGRRQFAVAVTVAIMIKLLMGHSNIGGEFGITWNAIGVIVPGLIANDMIKQSVVKTLYSAAIVSCFMFCIMLLMNGGF